MSLVTNKRAHFDYRFIKEFEAGIELLGIEVKSLRNKRGSLMGAHVVIRGGEAFLVGATIESYQPANTPESYESDRTRRLLLSKKELRELATLSESNGLTLVPISLYNKGKVLKLSFALAQGNKQRDKREQIKKRDTERSIERTLKQK